MHSIGTLRSHIIQISRFTRTSFRQKLLLLLLLTGCLLVAMHGTSNSAKSKSVVTVQAAGRGGRYLNLHDGRQMEVSYRGDQNVTEALRSGQARPKSLASLDLDGDAAPDLLAGYAYGGTGILTIQRGNPDAFAPKDQSVFARMQQGYNPDSLLPAADVRQVPEPVDFLYAGNFNPDGTTDVLLAARGGGLYVMRVDGQGRLGLPETISLPGVVTALTVGQFRAADGAGDVAVGVTGPAGSEVLVFDGAAGGFAAEALRFPLAAAATAVQFGELDSDPFMDLAVATGGQVEMVHGWGRKQQVSLQSRVERLDTAGGVRGLDMGFFIWNREAKKQLATLSEDGTIRILQRGQQDEQQFSDEEIAVRASARANQKRNAPGFDIEQVAGWQQGVAESWTTTREIASSGIVAEANPQNVLVRSNISPHGTDDLMVVGGNKRSLQIVHQAQPNSKDGVLVESAQSPGPAGDLASVNLDTNETPLAVLALPQKLNGERSVVVLQAQSAQPTIIPLAPTAIITVDRADDTAAASACTAAANDCSLRGAVAFANLPANAGSTINLPNPATLPVPAAAYTLNINGAGGCTKGGETNSIGDLEINKSTTISGAGSATTIIRQLGTGNATFPGDRVVCLNVPFTIGLNYSFSGLTITGGRDTTALAQAVGGGGLVGGAKDNTLSLTDVVVSNNQATGAGNFGGGGIQVTGGSVTITNCSIGGANAPGANRSDVTLANSEVQSGGGLTYSPGDPIGQIPSAGTLTITGTTFNRNTAASAAAGGGGADLLTHNQGTGSVSISTSTFSNNQATVANGGGIVDESIATTVATSALNTNSAGSRGGGIYVGGGSLLLNGTSPSITFSGNTATTAGSSISAASAVNVSGTNTTLGGDLEVTTNGIWTNNVGSTISPTNFIIGGTGSFTGNDSTTNMGGNFQFASGTFNAGTGLFNFNGSTAQSITNSSSITFNNLTDANTTQPLTLNNSLAVNGTLNVNGANAILDPVAATVISGSGTLTGTGTARVRRTAGTPDFSSQYTITNKTLTNLTVEYIGAAAQTVSALTYSVLKINNGSGVTLAAGTTTVNGTLILTAGALNVAANTLTLNNGSSVGAGTLTSGATGTVNYNQSSNGQSVLAGTYGNLTFSNFMKVLPSGTVAVAGTFTPGSGVGHTITGNTLDFNGTGAQTVPAFAYNNLTISGARGGATVTLASGNITVLGTFNPTATAVVYAVTGNTFDFIGTGAQSVPAFNYNNLTISGNRGGAAVTLGSGNVGVAGTFSPTATNNTYVTTGNTLVFNGSALQSVPAFSFGGLTLSNAAGANLAGDVTVNGALMLSAGALGVGTNTLTLNGAASFGAGSLTSAATGTVNYNQGSNGQATVLAANYGNLTFSNFSKTLASVGTIGIAGTFTPGSGTGHTITGSTINFNGAGTQTIPGFTYNNLTSSGGAVARTLDSVNTIKIAGVFTPGTNVYTITGSTIEYNGSAAQSLPSSGFNTYNNLTLNNPTTTTGFAGLTVNSLIEVKAGTFTSSSTYNNVQIDSGATLAATAAATINVSGSWTNNGGTFTPSTSTVNLNGSSAQTIGGTGTTTFNNLTDSNAAGISMTNDNTVNGILALTSSDITVAATKTLTQPVGGSSSGAFDVNGRVQRTGFVTGGAALSFGNPFNSIQVTAGTAPANIVFDLARSVPTGTMGYPTAVQRTYTITPSAAGFTGTVRLHYLPSELNLNDPTTLNLWRFDSGITAWRPNPATARDCAAGCTTNTSAFWVERAGVTTFSPWTLNSTNAPTAAGSVVTGRIVDANGAPVAGAVVRLQGTQNRKFITDANGVYRFEQVETNGFYTVTPSRSNYSFSPATRSFSQLGETTEATFGATASTSGFVNPLDTPEYFVRQHYIDFLGREPDESGFNFWSDQILECGADQSCIQRRRENVSAAYFLSIEFQETGGLVDGLYRASYGVGPQYAAFMPDARTVGLGVRVGDDGWQAKLAANKEAFVNAFVNRAAFHTAFDNLSNEDYVATLIQHTGVSFTAAERDALVTGLTTGATTRGAVLRSIAENPSFVSTKFNQAFVMMEYFGYLRRDADSDGYGFWLDKLNLFGGNFERADMVKAFIISGEYRDRFPR